jgi:hypothetical protein
MQHTSRGDEALALGLRPERLLNLLRGDVRDPVERARLEQWIESDAAAKLHWQSLRYFDAERDAARHDARSLENFTDAAAGDAAKLVACTDGEVFEPLWRSQPQAFGRSRDQWAEVCRNCVYCRRMRRVAYGRFESRAAPLHGEPLLREQLLAPYYERILAEKTRLLVGLVEPAVRPHLVLPAEAAEEATGIDVAAGDTALDLAQDTAVEPTKLPAQRLAQAAPAIQRAVGQLPPLHAWLVALCEQAKLTPDRAAAVFQQHFVLKVEDVEALLQSAGKMRESAARTEGRAAPAERIAQPSR